MFFESIKLLDGKLYNLGYHIARMEKTRAVFFPFSKKLELEPLYNLALKYTEGLFKIRLVYAKNIKTIEIASYEIKIHQKVRIVEVGDFDYPFKSSNRDFFNMKLHEKTGFDDILFIKEGRITDTTYCNVALYDGEQWFTPNSFLLPGTKRESLLDSGVLLEKEILIEDLPSYSKIAFVNAMRDFELVYDFSVDEYIILLNETKKACF